MRLEALPGEGRSLAIEPLEIGLEIVLQRAGQPVVEGGETPRQAAPVSRAERRRRDRRSR